MNLSKWAIEAVGWLKLALQAISIIKPKQRGKLINVSKALKELARMETAEGATTNAWRTITAAADAGVPATLTVEDCIYLASFKRNWFDRFFKEPLQILYRLTDWDAPPEV